MAFLAGDIVTAQRLNRLQPVTYRAKASAAVAGPQSATVIGGCSVTFDTETNGALAVVHWTADSRNTGAVATQIATQARLDTSTTSDVFTVWSGTVSGDKATVGTNTTFTITTAGTHTIDLVVSMSTSNQINVYTALLVQIFEVV